MVKSDHTSLRRLRKARTANLGALVWFALRRRWRPVHARARVIATYRSEDLRLFPEFGDDLGEFVARGCHGLSAFRMSGVDLGF